MTCWRLDTATQTLVVATDGGVPAAVYWGARLPEDEDLHALRAAAEPCLTGGMLDVLPPLSLTPTPGGSWQGQPGLVLRQADGTVLTPRFRFELAEQDARGLVLVSRDATAGLTLRHTLTVHPTGFLGLRSALVAESPVRVDWLAAPVLPVAAEVSDILDVAGRWIGEFQIERTPFVTGQRVRESRTGRSGQEHPPYALFTAPGCRNTAGEAWALHYAWSGGHRMIAEGLQDGRRQVQFGHAGGAETEPGLAFESAELLVTYSGEGLNGIATRFQHDVRTRIVTWPEPLDRRPRPVHYNCWEAVYFRHDLDSLTAIAERAAALGAERFVLDDGWFGRRDDDTSSLGDWIVDRRKWPDGLMPLIRVVEALGMRFGLWVEPEMVSEDSDLFRAHPDWVLGPLDQTRGRNQLVLDLARADVRDHLFLRLSALLAEHPIDYLKWDHNRLLPVVDAAQTRGIYELLARLRAAHPGVEIESCASGGGRIDAGILALTQRVWLSDSNDALERLRIQHDAALFLPMAVTGSHVGPRHCHTSGRVLDMSLRARTAAQRHMGFEMDLRELTDTEAACLGAVTAWWKANRDWLVTADILRLDASDPAVLAEQQLAQDGARFVVWSAQVATSRQSLPLPLRLTRLDPRARYRVRLTNPGDCPPQARGPNALRAGAVELSGAALMQQGLSLPVAWPGTLYMLEGERLDPAAPRLP
ncbi:alpha-galactosidase [Microvirga tunisiensis]|uniref:alpha-galactosidase n=1 Tax=Pannonibacter tanglangensis TaxID=2750084 RepID=A0A7X5F0M9_9HYPH|nr:alpha-galactosidase [Pannonibacter sp. XCT-53]NBN77586.1 alpha-galactosidase [Pannonibacter sp. XCT-53]